MLALSAVTATAAEASTEGPFFKVGGSRLESGQTRELTVQAAGAYKVSLWPGKEVTCTQVSASGAKLVGTVAGTPEYADETLTFSNCTISGNGAGCEVSSFKTAPLTAKLVYSAENRKGDLDYLYKPVSGSLFATLALSGSCETESYPLEGWVVGQAETASGERVQVGKEPAEAAGTEVGFPSTPPAEVWEGATPIEVKHLKSYGVNSAIHGSWSLELASKGSWGLFT